MMDWAHGPAGHFGGHPVPGLYHINTGSMLAKTRTIKNTLGVDFRACDNYKNGFEAAKQIKIPTLSILATDDKMCPVKEGKKLANLIEGSQIDIIDNCGHMMLLEEADRVLNVLKKFITERGKILPRRMTGLTSKQQRDLTLAVKRARIVALLPFVNPEG